MTIKFLYIQVKETFSHSTILMGGSRLGLGIRMGLDRKNLCIFGKDHYRLYMRKWLFFNSLIVSI